MEFLIGFIVGVIIGAVLGLIFFALLNASGRDDLPEYQAKSFTVGQTVLYDGQEWTIKQFNELGDGQTGVELENNGGRAYAMLEEVE